MTKLKPNKTSLLKIAEFCKKFNLPNLLIKDESKNPFGTWKDRRSEMIVKKAKHELVNKICLITSGNAGVSLANYANKSDIKVVSVVDLNLKSSIKQKLKKVCSKVIEINLSAKNLKPGELINLVRENKEEIILDATNGYHQAFESIIKEIKNEAPDYLICPVGSGEAFVGFFNGLKKAKLKTKLIGVSPKNNPSFADKLHTLWTPYAAKIQLTQKNGHKIIKLSEKEIKSAYSYAKKFMDCEPSSAIIIGALSKLNFKKNDKIIMINSGKGLIQNLLKFKL